MLDGDGSLGSLGEKVVMEADGNTGVEIVVVGLVLFCLLSIRC